MRNICSDDIHGYMDSIQPVITKCKISKDFNIDLDILKDTVQR
jgi:hypothetical protein